MELLETPGTRFGQDFEVEVQAEFETLRGYFGKMNSTLGSVVPLAMFSIRSMFDMFVFQGRLYDNLTPTTI